MKEIVVQKSWYDNLAATLATFCNYFDIKISRTSIFNSFSNPEKMLDFRVIEDFASSYSFEFSGGFFDELSLKNLPLPVFALVKGYRTVIIIELGDTVTYLDSLTGENTESFDEFLDYATGHYYYLDPNSQYVAEPNYEQLIATERELAEKKQWITPEVIEIRPESLINDFNLLV